MSSDFARKFIAYAKKCGLRARAVTIKIPQATCVSNGCKTKFPLWGAISFVAVYDDCSAKLMALAYSCPKCGRLYTGVKSPLQWKTYNTVFLDKSGNGVVKNKKGKVIHTFWTSKSNLLELGKGSEKKKI
jgi:hypothetical protein